VGAENRNVVASGIVVRDNVVYANEKVGIVFGGYRRQAGRVANSEFRNNTCWRNDTLGDGNGELWIQWAEDNVVRNNVFVSTAQNRLLSSDGGNVNNVFDYNLWWTAATGQDAHSPFAPPRFRNGPGADFHLGAASPAIDAGDPATVAAAGETDLDGAARLTGPAVDIGADEGCANGCC
jgi:hypothetical protein